MGLKTLAEFVEKINDITGNGKVLLIPDVNKGMTIAVEWNQEGEHILYGYLMSHIKITRLRDNYMIVFDQIYNDVARMVDMMHTN